MKLKLILAAALTAAGFSASQASVTLSVTADMLRDMSSNPASTNSLVALIADTDNNGVQAWQGSLSLGGYLDTSFNSDLILGLRTLGANSGTSGVFGDVFGTGGPGDPLLSFSGNWGAGDNLYLAWFPSYTISTSASVGGDYYGIVSLGATPSDGSTVSFDYWTTDDSGNVSGTPNSGSNPVTIANLQVQPVPEPSSFFVLAGLGLMGLLRRRVRRPSN